MNDQATAVIEYEFPVGCDITLAPSQFSTESTVSMEVPYKVLDQGTVVADGLTPAGSGHIGGAYYSTRVVHKADEAVVKLYGSGVVGRLLDVKAGNTYDYASGSARVQNHATNAPGTKLEVGEELSPFKAYLELPMEADNAYTLVKTNSVELSAATDNTCVQADMYYGEPLSRELVLSLPEFCSGDGVETGPTFFSQYAEMTSDGDEEDGDNCVFASGSSIMEVKAPVGFKAEVSVGASTHLKTNMDIEGCTLDGSLCFDLKNGGEYSIADGSFVFGNLTPDPVSCRVLDHDSKMFAAYCEVAPNTAMSAVAASDLQFASDGAVFVSGDYSMTVNLNDSSQLLQVGTEGLNYVFTNNSLAGTSPIPLDASSVLAALDPGDSIAASANPDGSLHVESLTGASDLSLVNAEGTVIATSSNFSGSINVTQDGLTDLAVENTGTSNVDVTYASGQSAVVVPGMTLPVYGDSSVLGTVDVTVKSDMNSKKQMPLENAYVYGFDMDDPCVAQHKPDALAVMTNCQTTSVEAVCLTNAEGQCSLIMPAGSKFLIAQEDKHVGEYPSAKIGKLKAGGITSAMISFNME
jgi:hypothetical protein